MIMTPSAPPFANTPRRSIAIVSGAAGAVDRPRVLAHRAHERSGRAVQGERRALRRGADPVRGARASDDSPMPYTGAPHPSIAVAVTRRREALDDLADVHLQGCAGSR
jgi:hypothetical protein